jgi:hypothetical protein
MDGLDCYGSSDDEEAEAQILVQAAVQPGIEMVEMASLTAAIARAAARAAAVAVNPFARPAISAAARETSASKRLAVAPPIPPLRALLVSGTSN